MSDQVRPARLRRFAPAAVVVAVSGGLALAYHDRLVAWFTGHDVAGAPSVSARVDAGGMSIATTVSPDPPRQTGNTIRAEVRDPAGAMIAGATVTVIYDMPAMGAMAASHGEASAVADSAGGYVSPLDLPMPGAYTIEVRVAGAAGAATARYRLTVGSPGLASLGGSGRTAPAAPVAPITPAALPPYAFAPASAAALARGFAAYEQVRDALAHDRLAAVTAPAGAITTALRTAASASSDAPAPISAAVREALTITDALAAAPDLEHARHQFGELSRVLSALAVADPRLQAGWHVFECPMATGYQGWFQRAPVLENPYMGTASPTCGGASRWSGPGATDTAPAPAPAESAAVTIDAAQRRAVGIGTEPVVRAPMTLDLRAVGRLTFDETRLSDVTSRVSGYITKLQVNATGQTVAKGDTLFTFYSPELYAAQQECLFAHQRATAAGADAGPDPLLRASETKLRLWGFGDAQLRALYARGAPLEDVPFLAPASGVVIEKDVVVGDAVQAGMRLFRIAALDAIWVEADLYEGDLGRIAPGQRASVALTYLPGRTFAATVAFVYPYLDPMTRTGRVRLKLPNKGLELKPDMYATVSFAIDLGPRVQVPRDAVIFTGPRRIVFVDVGEGGLAPRDVTIGAETADRIEILSGVEVGAQVVTSGNFLVASESRIRSATFWASDAGH
jgi:Cu(I)/Ag(I) efflux system membrane fusion protein